MIRFEQNLTNFSLIPGYSFAYWCKNFKVFTFKKLSDYYVSGGRNKTHNNDLFLRNWWEIIPSSKWPFYANGGDFRRWYGNNLDVVDWSDEAKNNYDKHGGLYNRKFWNKQGVCWNLITSYKNSFRIKESSFHYSSASPTIISVTDYVDDYCVLGFLNTELTAYLLKMINPTLNTTVSDVLGLPFELGDKEQIISELVKQNIDITKKDWDCFEASFEFKKHPLV